MPQATITLLELARKMNVSKAAVSLALRGRPGVSEALRARIVEEAERSGYKPNPVAVELMSIIHAQRHPTGGETIAFLNTYTDPDLFRKIPGLMDFFTGAKSHAAKFGYTLELFDVHAPHMNPKRLVGILKARGVRGVLVGPRWHADPDIDFPWHEFSAVVVGDTDYRQKLSHVCNHQTRSCATALQALVDRGYRRIGLALQADDERQHGHAYLIGSEMFLRSANDDVAVVTWIYDHYSRPDVKAWVLREKLDAVLTLAGCSQFSDLIPMLRHATGERIGYANLCVPAGANWSGIRQSPENIGAEAASLLRHLLQSGERGTGSYHRVLLVEGEWVDGDTAAPLPARHRARRARG